MKEGTQMVKLQDRSGFTLIELLIVVIIVAVLAGVGVPLLSANVQRARASEADAGLGTIRTGIRAYIAENTTLPAALSLAQVGVASGDLTGRYFSDASFTIAPTVSTVLYCIGANGATSTAFAHAQVQAPNLVRHSMDQNGTIFTASTDCT